MFFPSSSFFFEKKRAVFRGEKTTRPGIQRFGAEVETLLLCLTGPERLKANSKAGEIWPGGLGWMPVSSLYAKKIRINGSGTFFFLGGGSHWPRGVSTADMGVSFFGWGVGCGVASVHLPESSCFWGMFSLPPITDADKSC